MLRVVTVKALNVLEENPLQQETFIVSMAAGALLLSVYPLLAAEQDRIKDKIPTQTKEQERIYGSELMTEKERNEYRERMRNTKTEQERDKIRNEHHDRARADRSGGISQARCHDTGEIAAASVVISLVDNFQL